MHYSRPYKHYSEVFGIPERSIKRWVAIGKLRSPPDLPPFDAPAELADWWTRHMRQRHPVWLMSFLARTTLKGDAGDAGDKINTEEKTGLLEQAEQNRAIANRKLNAAYESGDEGRIAQCQRIWVDACEIVVKAERLDAEQQRIRGQWASISDISADLAALLEHLRQMRGNLARRVTADLAKLFDADQLREIQSAIQSVQSSQDSILRRLQALVPGELELETS